VCRHLKAAFCAFPKYFGSGEGKNAGPSTALRFAQDDTSFLILKLVIVPTANAGAIRLRSGQAMGHPRFVAGPEKRMTFAFLLRVVMVRASGLGLG
jgi:hypothetical protein